MADKLSARIRLPLQFVTRSFERSANPSFFSEVRRPRTEVKAADAERITTPVTGRRSIVSSLTAVVYFSSDRVSRGFDGIRSLSSSRASIFFRKQAERARENIETRVAQLKLFQRSREDDNHFRHFSFSSFSYLISRLDFFSLFLSAIITFCRTSLVKGGRIAYSFSIFRFVQLRTE